MSSWINEAAAVQNHNGNGFPHMNDPNNMGAGGGMGAGPGGMMDPSAFMANTAQFNHMAAGQFNPQQMAAAMQNGPMRNASPSFSNPAYQTNPVIPSKRPRPREDSIGASPRQNPGMLPTSRADTPQQSPFPGFQPNAMQPQNPNQPQHYSHLQPNGSTNASPSPVMAGNQLRPGSVPQRVNTASPHPFSPASQQFVPQASPVPSDHGGTPQPGMFMNPQNFPQGFNSGYTPSASPARPPSAQNPMAQQMMPPSMGQMPQQMSQVHPSQMLTQQMQQMQQMQAAQGRGAMDQQKMLYQMRLQQQLQQGGMPMAAQMQAQNMAQGRGMMPKQGMPMQNGQMPPGVMHPQQAAQIPRANNPEAFLKNLTTFMAMRQLPLETNPVIEGRPLHLLQLFQNVSKYGGYRNVTGRNLWTQVAASVGFNPQQIPSAPSQVRGVYEQNLLKFEEVWTMQQRTQHMKQQAGGPAGMPGVPGQGVPQRMGQLPHGQPMQPGQVPQMQQPHVQTPIKQITPAMQQASANGFSTPQQPRISQQQPNANQGHVRNSMSRSIDARQASSDFSVQSPASTGKGGSISVQPPAQQTDGAHTNGTTANLPFPGPFSSDPDEYSPCSREMLPDLYGGFDLESIRKLGNDLEKWRPDVPPPQELGHIDLHALTKSLQCGIHGEVRLALDVLGSVSRAAEYIPNLSIDLRACDDLVESLIDCAEEQVDLLVEKADPVSDEIDLTSYEDVVRSCRLEAISLRKPHIFGDAEYELEHAADRLLAITTILRNFSFMEVNQAVLADEIVVKFLCGVIRSLGTHDNLLRAPRNTLDFMKDVIILLSNITSSVEIPGREQALCLIQFLLAFAPSPGPSLTTERVVFSPFEPSLHPYLPHAVDSLAKLLARDEPNRTHYKIIFAADAAASPPYELLTRTFGLAVSPIPDQNKESRPANLPSFVEARKALLMQGLLAADIIAQLAPGYESGVTRAWLSSGEGFAQNLFRLIRTLCTQAEPTPRISGNPRSQPREDMDILYIITCGVSTLRKLSEKARDPNNPTSIPANALPSRDSLFGALQSLKSPKWAFLLNQLSTYAGLES
ncbi:SWI/SNF chromatin-remodeling complex subunit sol1 [Daldinia childiae]|uniref:SWI/SNF chromatin-remodeling complex subunit sol1 n=1 Tax=Daldinia childiae TaxID=326645 RepID=UPI0014459028|nr:SWI/SNF chromatin-remodeling complex subunit sol1 [Daldinia childiae]KAF3064449.1 SWI/SNF chromatin-remodeling complex subunit sol1 [Daldinia childiae]